MDPTPSCAPTDTASYEALRRRVRARLADVGWTQADAARSLGYDTDRDWSYVRRVLSGHETSRRLLLRLLALLDQEPTPLVKSGGTELPPRL